MQYIIHLHQFEPQTYHDELFDLKERILLRSLQLRVRDYPGEDRYLFDTIKDLKDLKKKVILVFIMNLHWRNDASAMSWRVRTTDTLVKYWLI